MFTPFLLLLGIISTIFTHFPSSSLTITSYSSLLIPKPFFSIALNPTPSNWILHSSYFPAPGIITLTITFSFPLLHISFHILPKKHLSALTDFLTARVSPSLPSLSPPRFSLLSFVPTTRVTSSPLTFSFLSLVFPPSSLLPINCYNKISLPSGCQAYFYTVITGDVICCYKSDGTGFPPQGETPFCMPLLHL